jgi:hypothetical protein
MNKEIEDILLQEIEGGYCSVPKMDRIRKAAAAIDRYLSAQPAKGLRERLDERIKTLEQKYAEKGFEEDYGNIMDRGGIFYLKQVREWLDEEISAPAAEARKEPSWNDKAMDLLKELVGELDRYDSRRLKFQQILQEIPAPSPLEAPSKEEAETKLAEYESVLKDIASGDLNSSRPQLLAQAVVDKYVESKGRKYLFYLDGLKYYTDSDVVTEEFLRSQLPLSKAKYSIYLEGEGDDRDQLLTERDSIIVSFPLPRTFYAVPAAMFSAPDSPSMLGEKEAAKFENVTSIYPAGVNITSGEYYPPADLMEWIKDNANDFCRLPETKPDIVITSNKHSLAGLFAWHDGAKAMYNKLLTEKYGDLLSAANAKIASLEKERDDYRQALEEYAGTEMSGIAERVLAKYPPK